MIINIFFVTIILLVVFIAMVVSIFVVVIVLLLTSVNIIITIALENIQ